MILSSIMLSVRESVFVATLAIILVGTLVFLEYKGYIPHYHLQGFGSSELYRIPKYLYISGIVFIFVSYTLLYITNYIVSNLKRFERSSRIANIELRKHDRIKNTFVLRLANDIKGHIYAIQNSLNVFKGQTRSKLDPNQDEMLNRAFKRTQIVSIIIKDLLNLTRMQMLDEFAIDKYSLRESIFRVVKNVSRQADEKSVSIETYIDENIETIYGNQTSTEEMLSTLLLNAIKYTEERGHVKIAVYDMRLNVAIDIEDNGIGIPKDSLKKIFEDFYRAPNARSFSQDGTGMGLSIVSEIVKKHKGKIRVESEENEGTAVSVILPKDPLMK